MHEQPANERLWRQVAASKVGTKTSVYKTSEELWLAAYKYFEWVADNPISEPVPVSYKGSFEVRTMPRMRAMTLEGLCAFIGVQMKTYLLWRREREEFAYVISQIDNVMYQYKFEGAAAGIFHAGLVSRSLGLVDKTEVETNATVVIAKDDADL